MESANRRTRNNLHTVEPDWDEVAQQKRERRRRRARRAGIVLVILLVLAVAYVLLMTLTTYTGYTVTEESERSDTSATHYLAFGSGYVKYSNDGASYVTVRDNTVWNQSYEMENPMIAVCDSYVALADRQGETVYVMDETGLQGEIAVTMPITRIDVAEQGTTAVLMTDGGTAYLSLFDKTGGQIAEGAIHVENTGTPMDIALSPDGKNLAVAIVDVSTGTARTTFQFYNFSAAGQNQIDNLVAALPYADTIAPEIAYVENGTMLAFADTGVYVFSGTTEPAESAWVEAADEIQSVFYDDHYFGIVYNDTSQEVGRRIEVYDTSGRQRTVIQTEFSFDTIGFLDNHEICMISASQCHIYKLSGAEKFRYEFDDAVEAIFHGTGYRGYVILQQDVTRQIRLTLFRDLFRQVTGSVEELS